MTARCWLFTLVLGFTLVSSRPMPAHAQRGQEAVLLLSVQRGGKVDAKLTHAVYANLLKVGEAMTRENALAGPERLCGNEECLSQLASREGAKAILSSMVQDNGPNNLYITVTLFDADNRTATDEKTICDHCTQQQVVSAIFDLSDRSLRTYRERKASAAAQSQAQAQPQSAQTAASPGQSPEGAQTLPGSELAGPRATAPVSTATTTPAPVAGGDFLSRWSPKRKIAAGVLTGLLIATLIPTVALHVTDGSPTTLIGCQSVSNFCVLHNLPLYAAGYAISGALAIGLGITFGWPTSKSASAAPSAAPVPVSTEGK